MLSQINVLPPQCLQANAQGQMPTCVQLPDGTWKATYPSSSGWGSGGTVAVIVIVALLLGVLVAAVRATAARRIAARSGLDPDRAAAVTLMTKDGLEATYLAASLAPTAPPTNRTEGPTVADRLRTLNDLRDQGLVTAEEYTDRRSAIIRGV